MSNKDILILSIITFITVLLWTFFEAYHVHITSTVPKSLREQIEPITPALQKDIVEKLRARYSESSLPTPVATTSSLFPSPSPVSTMSGSSF